MLCKVTTPHPVRNVRAKNELIENHAIHSITTIAK